MARYQLRDAYGRWRKPNLPGLRLLGGARPVAAIAGGRGVFQFRWHRDTALVGGYLGSAIVDLMLQELVVALRAAAPRSDEAHGQGTQRPWPHLQDSIHAEMSAGGAAIHGGGMRVGGGDIAGQVFIGFPAGLLEYGTRKMARRPFIFATYDRVEREFPVFAMEAAESLG